MKIKPPHLEGQITELFESYAQGNVSRREFMAGAVALGVAGAAASILSSSADAATSARAVKAAAQQAPVDIAEWSYFWVGVKRAELARGTLVNGEQMYVEYQIPARVRYPYPIVLVHGGGGQGTDWMGTPDGRPGWFQFLLQEGFMVYVVDRPGHGRSPYHPDLDGDFPPAATLDFLVGSFTPPQPNSPPPLPYQHLHTQWPGKGDFGSPDTEQLAASQGGAYVQPPAFGPPPGGGGPGGQGIGPMMAAMFNASVPANQLPPSPAEAGTVIAHSAWRERGAQLLDKIGPAIIMTHSAGGPFGWLVAEVRPKLVKGIVVVEGAAIPFVGGNRWGLTSISMTYDPPVADPKELQTTKVTPTEPGLFPYYLQADPPRKLTNLRGIPQVVVTAEASFFAPGNPGVIDYLKQSGCQAEELRLAKVGVHGNGHMMMVEKNNRQVLQPIIDWIKKNVPANDAAAARTAHTGAESTALQLADQGFFWVGTQEKKVAYGTIVAGQMYVQYLIPKRITQPHPIVLVHGGTGQMLHYMGGGDSIAGWAHYYVQAGYQVYLVDRPGHGRAPYHPDALGPIGFQPTYDMITGDSRRSAMGPNRRWPGTTGDIGDPLLDQFMACQNGMPRDFGLQHALWASRGAELLDKIGPAIIQTHSAGGAFGWLAADQRPDLVKAIVVFEGGFPPFSPISPWGITVTPLAYDPPASKPSDIATREMPPKAPGRTPYRLQADPPRKLKNLQKVPTLYLEAENSGRVDGYAVVEYLRQAGAPAEYLNLKDKGILGNGHFAMIETNRKEVFEVIRGWIEQKLPLKS